MAAVAGVAAAAAAAAVAAAAVAAVGGRRRRPAGAAGGRGRAARGSVEAARSVRAADSGAREGPPGVGSGWESHPFRGCARYLFRGGSAVAAINSCVAINHEDAASSLQWCYKACERVVLVNFCWHPEDDSQFPQICELARVCVNGISSRVVVHITESAYAKSPWPLELCCDQRPSICVSSKALFRLETCRVALHWARGCIFHALHWFLFSCPCGRPRAGARARAVRPGARRHPTQALVHGG